MFSKKKGFPKYFCPLSLAYLSAVPLTVQATDHTTRHSQRLWTASDRSSEEICSETEIQPTPTTSPDSTRSSRAWVFGRILDSAGSLKPTLAEHGFSVGSQIRLSVGFRPNPVKDLIRPASERGKERKSVDLLKGEREREREREEDCANLLKGEREGDSAFLFFIFYKTQHDSATFLSMQFGTFCLENI